MDTDGGGWTVFQRRQDGSQDFYRYWDDYKHGFGTLTGEFWLGLSKIHYLTNSAVRSELRVDLRNTNGNTAYAKYRNFGVGDSVTNYTLTVVGYTGTTGDGLITAHNGLQFTTRDRDNDKFNGGNCARYNNYNGGWWYRVCFVSGSNLNGIYGQSMHWLPWNSVAVKLVFTEMKVRSV